ncbi:hypothetical protein Sru01_63700 [Sphaerisporangium rufum]|uniref:Bacteriocin biosynthesis cyclodehydratase domain-containing protein n=1 Tax=Sphaerisporangium rufum TaxID=1381558 RepID=A0A919V4N4_9ACTN|nr:hypothetical protein [Sphaerisporangium rufum]GII81388.1 hypothetical protein Sru01_63700 [Sphaerisporangium rufum]
MNLTHVIAIGPFAADVARVLQRRNMDDRPTFFAQGHGVATSLLPPADVYVLVTSRHDSTLVVEIGDLIGKWGAAFVPVVHETRWLRAGPLSVPDGTGACAECFERRSIQHSVIGGALSDLHAFYARDPAGPGGHLPTQVLTAAGLAQWGVDAIRSGGSAAHGAYRAMNLAKPQFMRGRTLGVHGCPRCHPRSIAAPDRSWRGLADHLAAVGTGAKEGT